jgi:hypothetical protein
MATAFSPVALVGRLSPVQLFARLQELDHNADYWRDEQERTGAGTFGWVKASQRLDSVNEHIVAIERELRQRFDGIDLMALAGRIG